MELRQLEVFRVVADVGTLSRAADRLHLAQPVLSRQIKALETELRVALFTRTGRGMELTDAGAELLRRGDQLVEEMRRLRDDLRSFEGVPRGAVVLGLVPTVSEVISARVAATVVERFPEISLRVVESYTGHLVDWMHRGELDIAVVYESAEAMHLVSEPLGTEALIAVGADSFDLPRDAPISLADLASRPLALPGPGHGLRSLVDRAAREQDLDLNIVVEADSFRVLLDIVARGTACSVLPASATEHRGGAVLTGVSIVKPRLERSLLLATPIGHAPTLAMSAVLDVVRTEVERITRA